MAGVLALLSSPAALAVPASSIPPVFLGPDGVLYAARTGPDGIGLDPLPGLGGAPVRDVAPAGAGRLLVLTAGTHPSGRRGAGAGWLDVLRLEGSPPRLVPERRVEFPGEGRAVVAGPDGAAWVLARGGGREQGGVAADRVHRIDRDSGQVTATAALPGAAEAMVLSPAGDRLYVGLPDRIVTLAAVERPVVSWFHRSPGRNAGLAFRPGTDVLYAARGEGIAVFDPALIAARGDADRHAREDDATAVIPLPFQAEIIHFSGSGRLAAVTGAGSAVALIDAVAGAVLEVPAVAAAETAGQARAIGFPDDRTLILALFPDASAVPVHLPELPAAEPARPPAESPSAAAPEPARVATTEVAPPPADSLLAEPASPAAAAETSPAAPEVAPAPAGAPVSAPSPPQAEAPSVPRPGAGGVLRGCIEGNPAGVAAVIAYGPDSIVREQARAAPGADGCWEMPLPPAGTYRVIVLRPAGAGGRVEPNFHTVRVAGQGVEGIDFRVVAGP